MLSILQILAVNQVLVLERVKTLMPLWAQFKYQCTDYRQRETKSSHRQNRRRNAGKPKPRHRKRESSG
ncbi:hypothetical protein A6B39_07475 [Mannheimia granulomatis]|nr:hypothetical protein A6B39_07475 [Mannheimia granulomatis]